MLKYNDIVTELYFKEEDVNCAINSRNFINGVVYRYDPEDKRGTIIKWKNLETRKIYFYQENTEDVFNFKAGDKVKFRIKKDGEKPVAYDVIKTGHINIPKKHKWIYLPNGCVINATNVYSYGVINTMNEIMKKANVTEKDIYEHGYKRSNFTCVFIHCPGAFYHIYEDGAPVKGDGHVKSLSSFIEELNLCVFNSDGNIAKEKELRDIIEEEKKKEIELSRYKKWYVDAVVASLVLKGIRVHEADDIARKRDYDYSVNPKDIAEKIWEDSGLQPSYYYRNDSDLQKTE